MEPTQQEKLTILSEGLFTEIANKPFNSSAQFLMSHALVVRGSAGARRVLNDSLPVDDARNPPALPWPRRARSKMGLAGQPVVRICAVLGMKARRAFRPIPGIP